MWSTKLRRIGMFSSYVIEWPGGVVPRTAPIWRQRQPRGVTNQRDRSIASKLRLIVSKNNRLLVQAIQTVAIQFDPEQIAAIGRF
jgi:hypothetical protein